MEDETILYETDFWKVILSPDQAYLGRCVIVLKRDCGKMSNLRSDEWMDLHKNIIQKLEPAFKKAFNATMFNWTCLMNGAFKAENPKPHIHWHFRPRYRENVKFAGEQFQDLEFADHYDAKRRMIVSKDILENISEEVKKYLQ
jgi:diadenosine tetraphosphate (Ap4A) HIT family hydrolase